MKTKISMSKTEIWVRIILGFTLAWVLGPFPGRVATRGRRVQVVRPQTVPTVTAGQDRRLQTHDLTGDMFADPTPVEVIWIIPAGGEKSDEDLTLPADCDPYVI